MNDARRPRGRLLWRLGAGATPKLLDVRERLLSPSVDIFIDDESVASLPKPTRQNPWVTADISVPGAGTHTVALSRAPWGLVAEVFKDGMSLADGRSLEQARADAPPPMDAYARATGLAISGVSTSRLFPRWVALAAVLALLSLAGAMVLRTGVVGAELILVGSVLGTVVFIRTWLVFTAKVHARLLHDHHGSAARFAALVAVFLAVPLGLLLVTVLVASIFQPT